MNTHDIENEERISLDSTSKVKAKEKVRISMIHKDPFVLQASSFLSN